MKLTFPTVLFLVLLTLKLTHVIAWSWWWIAAPIWVVVPAVFLFALFAALIAALANR